MENFNLVTEEDKNEVYDSQMFNRLIEAERNPNPKSIKDFFTEKGQQLREYQKQYREGKKQRNISLKAKGINLLNEYSKEYYEKFADPIFLNEKIRKIGGFTKKHENFFNIPSIIEGKGTKKGHTIYSHFSINYSQELEIVLKISLWDNGAKSDTETRVKIFKLNGDTPTAIIQPYFIEKVNEKEEIEKAKEYLKFLKESEKKLRELKGKCNHYMLDIIENNI